MAPQPKTRVAIVGTAPSFRKTPWTDNGLHIVSLNDAYSMPEMKRADEWYDIHPLNEMWFREKHQHALDPRQIPKLPDGRMPFIRPKGHIEWLKQQAQTIPVWLKDAPPADWPANAQAFPLAAMEQTYGTYWASGPAYMVPHLYDRGFREFFIYGIHLATKQEYIEQRPNWEMWLGRLVGMQVTERVADGMRYYEGKECLVALPVEAPILKHGWKYGMEPKPLPPDLAAQERFGSYATQHRKLIEQLVTWPRWKSKGKPMAELKRLQALMRDAQMEARHAVIAAGR